MILDHITAARERCWDLCRQLTTMDQKLLLLEITAALNSIAEETAPVPEKKRDARDGPTRAANDRTLLES